MIETNIKQVNATYRSGLSMLGAREPGRNVAVVRHKIPLQTRIKDMIMPMNGPR